MRWSRGPLRSAAALVEWSQPQLGGDEQWEQGDPVVCPALKGSHWWLEPSWHGFMGERPCSLRRTLQSQEEQLTVWSWGRADMSRGLQPALSSTRTGPGLRGRWYRKSGTFQLSEPPGPLWQEVSLSLVHPCWGWGASLGESLLTKGSQLALVVKNPPANTGAVRDAGSLPGLGRSPGEGIGNSLQYSCLENPMDRDAWQATVHELEQSQTRLNV